jgi:hypothetical protein
VLAHTATMRGAGALTTPQDPDVPAPPTLARVPEPRASVDDQILRLESRLLAEAGGDPDREQALLGHLARARAHFASATVRQFLPILIEREVRRLAAQ